MLINERILTNVPVFNHRYDRIFPAFKNAFSHRSQFMPAVLMLCKQTHLSTDYKLNSNFFLTSLICRGKVAPWKQNSTEN